MASILFETTPSTMVFGEEDESWDDNVTDNVTIRVSGSTSSNINGLLFPAIFASLIVLANIVSLASFCVEKRLRTYNNYFIINLSILDLLVGLRLGISVAHTHLRYFPFSQNACKIISGFSHAFTSASNFTVVVICVDRHRATYDPINHFMSRSKQKALFKNAIPWLFGLAFWLPYVTVWEFVEGFDNGVHCLRRFARLALTQVITNTVMFFGPFLIIAVLYFRIFTKIKSIGKGNVEKRFATKDQSAGANRSKVVENYSVENISTISNATTDVELNSADTCDETFDQPTSKKNADGLQRKVPKPAKRESVVEMRKATRTLLLIVISFVIAWLPSSIIQLTYTIEPVLIISGFPRPVYLFFSYLVYANNLLNPISYVVSQPLFRSTIIRMVLCRRR